MALLISRRNSVPKLRRYFLYSYLKLPNKLNPRFKRYNIKVVSSRIDAIKKIEDLRKSKVIVYLTGDRQPFQINVGEDIIPILYKHLESIGVQDKIDLFLYTRGGDMVVPIRVVKLIRNYCKKFSVIVPYRCHSAGTLICVGADEIVMTKIAELTPVDPTSMAHPFNPRIPNPANVQQQIQLPISVEDVRSYLSFAKDAYGAKDEQIIDLFSKMTNQQYASNTHLHPLSLGNVYRVQKMIKFVSERLLRLHFKNFEQNEKTIKKIVQAITEDISVHNYPIYFDEAKELGLNVSLPDKSEEKLFWDLFMLYSDSMKLSSPFNVVEEVGAAQSFSGVYSAGYIESLLAEDVFNIKYEITKITIPGAGVPAINLNLGKQLWEKTR